MNRKKTFCTILASVLCACAVGTYFASREASVDLNNTSKAKALSSHAGEANRGVQVQVSRSGDDDPTLLRREVCHPDFSEQLAWTERGELPQKGEVFSLRFFDDKAFDFHVEKAQRRLINGKSIIAVSGRTRENGLQVASFIVADGKVRTTINDFENSRLYSIAYDFTRGQYFSSEQDTTKTPECGTCKDHACAHDLHAAAPVLSEEEVAAFQAKVAAAGESDKAYVVDYLVVYDTTGRDYAQNRGGTEALAADAVVQMNNCFDNSNIDAAYRLAGTEVLENYTSDGNFYNALYNITPGNASGDPEIQEQVAALREFYGADLVQLYHVGNGVAGLGWAPGNGAQRGSMFSVVGASYAAGVTSAHEAGHNMGCQHSREQTQQPGSHDYAVGANSKVAGQTRDHTGHKQYYHTVMSYGINWPSEDGNWNENTTCVPIFSGPNSVWDGVSLGSDTENNCRMLNESLPRAADFYTPGPFSVSSVGFESNGGTQSLRLDTTYEWTLSIDGAPWVTLDQSEGTGVATVNLTAEANPYCVPRTGKIVAVVRDSEFELDVTQKAAPAVLKLIDGESEVTEWTNIGRTGATRELSVETNWPSLTVDAPSWVNATLNLTTKTLTLVVAENEALKVREGEVRLYYPGDKANPVSTLKLSQERGEPFLVVYDNEDILLGKGAGRKNVYVHTNVAWKVTAGADCSWMTVSTSSSTETAIGSGYVLLNYTENLSTSVRTGTLTFVYADADGNMVNSAQVSVSQKESPPFVTLDKASLAFNYKAASQKIKLQANTDWALTSELPEWLTLSATSGSAGTAELVVSVAQNSDRENGRTATLTFVAGGKTAKLSVAQGLMQSIVAETSKITFPSEGGTRELKLHANGTWKAIYWPEWVSITPQNGNAPADGILVIRLKAEANTGAAALKGALTLECGESRLQIDLEQQRPYAPQDNEVGKAGGFEAFEYADEADYIYLSADGEERCVLLGFEVGDAQIAFALDPEWLACELEADTPCKLWVQAVPNTDGELRETWVFILTQSGNLHAIPVKQAQE
ncbi:MAG: hypothetical protein IKW49_06185 [Opitutales bacterium]|nr:hypothetical protein [Opitutales bacterium]